MSSLLSPNRKVVGVLRYEFASRQELVSGVVIRKVETTTRDARGGMFDKEVLMPCEARHQ